MDDDAIDEAIQENKTKTTRPPPVILRSTHHWGSVRKKMQVRNIKTRFITIRERLEVKIPCEGPEDFKKLTKYLREERTEVEWYTHIPQDEKRGKIVIKGLTNQEDLDEIFVLFCRGRWSRKGWEPLI